MTSLAYGGSFNTTPDYEQHLFTRQSQSHFVVTGVQGLGAPNRIEINDFVKQDDQFSLFIQALSALQNTTQSLQTSYFQMGGIHGLPFIEWGGSGGDTGAPGSWGGYCTHGNVLFPTWHRPYTVLFEQVMQEQAIAIANTYEVNAEQFMSAAQTLRVPYWDWALNSVPPDEVIQLRTVTITAPDGTRKDVSNPLYQYDFHPIDSSFPSPYSNWQSTLRHPTNQGASAVTSVADLRSRMESVQEDVRASTYNMLTRVRTWEAFSNHDVGDGGSTSNSLEAIHDGVHSDVGGAGHMADPAVAGFDPIFFLHHANVDRLVALWSAINPGVWVTNGPAGDGTWTIPATGTVDNTTNLTPFWNSESTYWLSTDSSSTQRFGYSYPEFNGLDMNNPQAVRTSILATINKMYGDSASFAAEAASEEDALAPFGLKKRAHWNPFDSDGRIQLLDNLGGGGDDDADDGDSNAYVDHQNIWDWTVRIQVDKHALPSTFSVLIFLGDVPEDSKKWRKAPSFVGSFSAFAHSMARHRGGPQLAQGFVHLNRVLARTPDVHGFDPEDVQPYLREHLQWRVMCADGTVVDPGSLESLEVVSIGTPVKLQPGAELPDYGEPNYYYDITEGKPGGARSRLDRREAL
ncbi:photo-regulated tyrosinase [Peniophora sp. CONT]|nr:photo-regulated tyrosinase [Peniophora sp. CONT]